MSIVIPLDEAVHDWAIRIGTWEFGVREYELDLGSRAPAGPTFIFIGPKSYETTLSAWTVVGIGAASLLVAIALTFVVTKLTARKREPG
jgi:hypothetical protein